MYTLEDSRLAKTRTLTATKLDQDKTCKNIKVTSFSGVVSSVLYLTTNWLDSMFSTCLSARFHVDPRESYPIATKWCFSYLQGSSNLSIWYPLDTSTNQVGYIDSDHTGCKIDRKLRSCWSLRKSLFF